MMIYGLAPAPFGPGLLQFLLHDCDLRALTPAFISEWYPELHHTLQNWKALDPSSNDLAPFCSHFATYHDTEVISISLVTFYIVLEYYWQIGAFYDCNTRSHNAIGVEMLYHTIVGPVLPTHSEFEAFFEGFKLETDNGFSMLQVLYHKSICVSSCTNSLSFSSESSFMVEQKACWTSYGHRKSSHPAMYWAIFIYLMNWMIGSNISIVSIHPTICLNTFSKE